MVYKRLIGLFRIANVLRLATTQLTTTRSNSDPPFPTTNAVELDYIPPFPAQHPLPPSTRLILHLFPC